MTSHYQLVLGFAPGLTFLWIAAQGRFYFQKLMFFPAASSMESSGHASRKNFRLALGNHLWQIGK
jgi:hypothetical protein